MTTQAADPRVSDERLAELIDIRMINEKMALKDERWVTEIHIHTTSALRELVAARREIKRYREALQRVVTHAADDHDGMTYQELSDMAADALRERIAKEGM